MKNTDNYLRNYQCKCIKSQLKKITCPDEILTVFKIDYLRKKNNCHTRTLISIFKCPPSPSPNLTEYMPPFSGEHFLNVQHSLFQVPQTTSESVVLLLNTVFPLNSALWAPHPPWGVFFNIWFQFQNSGTSGTYSAFIYAAQDMIHLCTDCSFNQKRIFSIQN